MPKFVIERTVPGVENLAPAELKTVTRQACGALDTSGTDVHWIETFVAADKVYCVFYAPDEQTLLRVSQQSGIPMEHVAEVAHADSGTNQPAAASHPATPD